MSWILFFDLFILHTVCQAQAWLSATERESYATYYLLFSTLESAIFFRTATLLTEFELKTGGLNFGFA